MKKLISTLLILSIVFSCMTSSLAYSFDENNKLNLVDDQHLKNEIEKLTSSELDISLDKYYETNDKIFMELCKEKSKRENVSFDMDKYEKEIRNAKTPEEFQKILDKYDKSFIFKKKRSITDNEFNELIKTDPEFQNLISLNSYLTADDFEVIEEVAWRREELIQDEKEGIFNEIMDTAMGIGIGYFAEVAGIVYSFVGYFGDDDYYYNCNTHTSTVADESLTTKTTVLKGTEYPSYGYAERKRRYDTVKITIWEEGGGKVIYSNSKFVDKVRDQFYYLYLDEESFMELSAERYNNGAWPPTYLYNCAGAEDYTWDRTYYFDY